MMDAPASLWEDSGMLIPPAFRYGARAHAALAMAAGVMLLSTSGCLVATNMPELRYVSPFPSGTTFSGHAVASAGRATRVVLVPSTLVSPPDTDHPAFDDADNSLGVAG